MMYHDGWGFFGMHAFWWLFWIIVVVAFFSLLDADPLKRGSPSAPNGPGDPAATLRRGRNFLARVRRAEGQVQVTSGRGA